jgi:hypothetical protein
VESQNGGAEVKHSVDEIKEYLAKFLPGQQLPPEAEVISDLLNLWSGLREDLDDAQDVIDSHLRKIGLLEVELERLKLELFSLERKHNQSIKTEVAQAQTIERLRKQNDVLKRGILNSEHICDKIQNTWFSAVLAEAEKVGT